MAVKLKAVGHQIPEPTTGTVSTADPLLARANFEPIWRPCPGEFCDATHKGAPAKKPKIKLTDAFIKALRWEEGYQWDKLQTVHRVSAGHISECSVHRIAERHGGEQATKHAKEKALKQLAEEVLKWVEIVEE